MQAIFYIITGKIKEIKKDSVNSYKIAVQSKSDIQTIINLFSFSDLHPLIGYKAIQYESWLYN